MKKRVRKEGVCCSRGAATPFINNDLSQEESFIGDCKGRNDLESV